ncbi:uncharacterized protein LOC128384335 [Scomber japonicus]|uniref:uncharacterized protein LOC128384335 n=1 Tax=Scomber japonicus TaxID=13676 RepID=UPI00230557C2|nr:uncharacterized protein LOC128384335 [Scomber japonicus]
MEENQNLDQNTNNLVIKIEELHSTGITTYLQGIDNSNNTVDDSNAPHHWLTIDIKHEKEEEEEQSISQREDLLDFTDQNQYKIKMEENENQGQEHHTDHLVIKREESDSPSATTDIQGIDNSDIKQEKEEEEEQSISQRGDLLDFSQDPEHHTNHPVIKREESDSSSSTTDTQGIDNSDIKQEKEEEQSISQRGDQLDFTDQDQEQDQNQNQNPEHHTNNPIIERGESDSPSATTDTQVSVRVCAILFFAGNILAVQNNYRTYTYRRYQAQTSYVQKS